MVTASNYSYTVGIGQEWPPAEGRQALPYRMEKGANFLEILGLSDSINSALAPFATAICPVHKRPVAFRTTEQRIEESTFGRPGSTALLTVELQQNGEHELPAILEMLNSRRYVSGNHLFNRDEAVKATTVFPVLSSASLPLSAGDKETFSDAVNRTRNFSHRLFLFESRTKEVSGGEIVDAGLYCSACEKNLPEDTEFERIIVDGTLEIGISSLTFAKIYEFLKQQPGADSLKESLSRLVLCGFGDYLISHKIADLTYQERVLIAGFRLLDGSFSGRKLIVDRLFSSLSDPVQDRLYQTLRNTVGKNNSLTIIDEREKTAVECSVVFVDDNFQNELSPGEILIINSATGEGLQKVLKSIRTKFLKRSRARCVRSEVFLKSLPEFPLSVFNLEELLASLLRTTVDGKRLAITSRDLSRTSGRYRCQCLGKGCSVCDFTGLNDIIRALALDEVSVHEMLTQPLVKWARELSYVPVMERLYKLAEAFDLHHLRACEDWYAVQDEERILLLIAGQLFNNKKTPLLIEVGAELTRCISDRAINAIKSQYQKWPTSVAMVLVANDRRLADAPARILELNGL